MQQLDFSSLGVYTREPMPSGWFRLEAIHESKEVCCWYASM